MMDLNEHMWFHPKHFVEKFMKYIVKMQVQKNMDTT